MRVKVGGASDRCLVTCVTSLLHMCDITRVYGLKRRKSTPNMTCASKFTVSEVPGTRDVIRGSFFISKRHTYRSLFAHPQSL